MVNENKLPLLSNQKRLWILTQQDKENPAYNLQLSYHLQGSIDSDILNRSLTQLFEWQYSMFSVFKQESGIPYIELIPGEVKAEFIDFSDLPVESRKDKILAFAGDDSRKCFNIEVGPLYRIYLLKENNESFYFHATIHHLIFDGWSRRIFVSELSNIYNNIIKGVDKSLEPLSFSGFEYEEIEKAGLPLRDQEELMAFWKESLKNCPAELKFPYDYHRSGSLSGLGCREYFEISEACSEKLKDISREEGASLFNTVLTLLGVLFQKYTGESDICIGVPVSTRKNYSSIDNIFGLFVNTVVVRLIIDGDKCFREFLRNSKKEIRQAIHHSKLPFEKIVETVNPDRAPGINPLFQVSLSWLNDMTGNMDLNGVVGERIHVTNGVSPFDFTFYMWEKGNTIQGEIEFSSDLLKKETAIRLKDSFLTLIKNTTDNFDASLNSISIISDEELNKIISFSGFHTDYPKNKSIIELFEEQVEKYPYKPAAVFNGESFTYSQLNEKANQLARTLKSAGVGSNIPVGILADKSLLLVISILGVLKAGGAYVPIDPEYPLKRVNFIIKDSSCKIVLTQDKYLDLAIEGVLLLNLNDKNVFQDEKTNLEVIRNSSDLAYIIYTSGTTGIPKGSMILNYSVVRLVRNTNYINITSDDRILLTGAIAFDSSTFEIWGTLLNGGTLFITQKETILDAKELGAALFNNNISILWLTSPLFTIIAESRADIFSQLRYLLVGGDVLSPSHINKVRKSNPQLKIINGYGPTENTTFSTTFLIDKDYTTNIPIGKPISNSTAYIFDKNLNYQPVGVIGNLYVGGDGLTKGYLNRDDLNSSCFIVNPYNNRERLYRTGDRAKWLSDGNIEFHGRADNQIKIRGFRVELEEIESIIAEIDTVKEVVVKPVKIGGEIRLVAFLSVSDTTTSDNKDIIDHIKEILPSYMIPSVFNILGELPKNANGKIDRNKLIFDKNEFMTRSVREFENMSQTEKVLFGVWKEALKIKDISVKDNFFDIGGNSFLAISVMSMTEKMFNLELGLKVFFDSPRIKDLAELINIKLGKEDNESYVSDKRDDSLNMINGEI